MIIILKNFPAQQAINNKHSSSGNYTTLELARLLPTGRKNLIQNFTGTLVVPDETGTKIFLTHTCKKLKTLCYTDPDSLNGLSR